MFFSISLIFTVLFIPYYDILFSLKRSYLINADSKDDACGIQRCDSQKLVTGSDPGFLGEDHKDNTDNMYSAFEIVEGSMNFIQSTKGMGKDYDSFSSSGYAGINK